MESEHMQQLPCTLDSNLLANLLPCMADDSILASSRRYLPFDPFANPDGFPLCCISKQTVVYSCGGIARRGAAMAHNHPAGEIELCRQLATQSAELMKGFVVGMGSEGTPFRGGSPYFLPFFRTANIGDPLPGAFTDAFIRSSFGDTIFPKCQIHVESLAEDTEWWKILTECYVGLPDDEVASRLTRWRCMIDWFTGQQFFRITSYIRIREKSGEGGSVFPRLVLGMTNAGSIAGLINNAVHT
jgi:hypothetical protein